MEKFHVSFLRYKQFQHLLIKWETFEGDIVLLIRKKPRKKKDAKQKELVKSDKAKKTKVIPKVHVPAATVDLFEAIAVDYYQLFSSNKFYERQRFNSGAALYAQLLFDASLEAHILILRVLETEFPGSKWVAELIGGFLKPAKDNLANEYAVFGKRHKENIRRVEISTAGLELVSMVNGESNLR